MSAIGGFFELELVIGGPSYHDAALALCSGRSCLRRILKVAKPQRVHVPFFICDSALVPFQILGIPYIFYRLTRSLEPELADVNSQGDCLLYVNYFGLKAACAAELVAGSRVMPIIDDTQAFYQRGYDGAWSFNSARKFFGVPDGGYAYGPKLLFSIPSVRFEDVRYDHLLNRFLGRQELAYRQYLENERKICAEILGPSILAERILAGIDYNRVRQIRRQNFGILHERLKQLNRLPIDLDYIGEAVPFCYPFLPETNISFEALWRQKIFVPQLWPEILQRSGAGFDWERQLASRLLPLPIDHRYGVENMDQICDAVLEEIG